jgi:flagellar basal body rod protein FlgB
MMKIAVVFSILCLLMLTRSVCAEGAEDMFMSKQYTTLEDALKEGAKKQAMYAYDIANLSSPDFRPILTREDQQLLSEVSPESNRSKEVLTEFLMSRMSENTKKYNALLALWKLKTDNNKRIVTLGK